MFPSLVIQPKWHVARRNVMVGDVVLLQDSNVLRGEWKMGIISEITASKDGLVRRVNVTYNRDSTKYTVSRAVQRLIVLVPKDEEEGGTDANGNSDNSSKDKSNKEDDDANHENNENSESCLLYTSPSPRDISGSRMPSSA